MIVLRDISIWRRLFKWKEVCAELEAEIQKREEEWMRTRVSHELAVNALAERESELQKAKDGTRTLLQFITEAHGLRLQLALLFICLNCLGAGFPPPFVHNVLNTNAVGLGADNSLLSISAGVPFYTSTIIAQVQNVTDTAAKLDTNKWPLAVLTWPFDAQMLRMGDGATFGGVNAGVRYWPTPTNAFLADGRPGELAISQSGNNQNTAVILGPILWFNGGGTGTNLGSGTNWFPLVGFVLGQTNAPINPLTNPVPLFVFGFGTNGYNPAVTPGQSLAGTFNSALIAYPGSGGNAFDNSGNNAGGNGANNGTLNQHGGAGGNATSAIGVGGNGALAGNIQIFGGNGGDDATGNGGGNGGGGGGWQSQGGNGAIGQGGGPGGNGGPGGGILANGGNASATLNGGPAGTLTMSANGIFGGGNLTTSGTLTRDGGSTTTFASSYLPATLFTTTTTAGPSASSSEVSLLGTATFLSAHGSPQAQGKNIGSNVVDHIGRTLRFKLSGYIATSLTPTLEIRLKLGGTTIIDTGAQTLVAITGNETWTFSGEITFRTTGSAGTCIGQGVFEYFSAATTLNAFSTANTATSTFDTTKDESIDCTGQFGANNTLQCTTAIFELLN